MLCTFAPNRNVTKWINPSIHSCHSRNEQWAWTRFCDHISCAKQSIVSKEDLFHIDSHNNLSWYQQTQNTSPQQLYSVLFFQVPTYTPMIRAFFSLSLPVCSFWFCIYDGMNRIRNRDNDDNRESKSKEIWRSNIFRVRNTIDQPAKIALAKHSMERECEANLLWELLKAQS